MKQNVILNKIHSNMRSKYSQHYINIMAADMYTLYDKWNECVREVAEEFRSEGLEASAKEAEKWIEKVG